MKPLFGRFPQLAEAPALLAQNPLAAACPACRAVAMTQDHKPMDTDEYARIMKVGRWHGCASWVCLTSENHAGGQVPWVCLMAVCTAAAICA